MTLDHSFLGRAPPDTYPFGLWESCCSRLVLWTSCNLVMPRLLAWSVCHCLSLSIAVCQCLSLSVTVCHCLSLSIAVCQCLSLSVTVCHCLSLSVTVCHCLSLSVTVCHCLSLSVTVCHCLLLSVTVYRRCLHFEVHSPQHHTIQTSIHNNRQQDRQCYGYLVYEWMKVFSRGDPFLCTTKMLNSMF